MILIALSILLSLLYYYMGFYAYFNRKDASINRLFLMLCVVFSGWSFAGSLFNVINIPAVSSIWILSSYFIWTVGTALILHFCLLINNETGYLKLKTLTIIYLPAFIFLLGMTFINGLTPSYAIYTTALRMIFGIPGGIIFYVIYISIAIYQLVMVGYATTDHRVKKQSRLISLGLLAASLFIGLYAFVFPLLVLHPLPVLLPFFPAIWIVSMWLSITKYGFLKVTMEFATIEILDNIQEIIVLMDDKSTILDVNKKFEELVNMDKKAISGKSLDAFIPKDSILIRQIGQVKKKEILTYTGDVDFQLNNNIVLPLRAHISSIVDPLGKVIGILIAANDLTLEKKYELLSITDGLTNAYNRMKMERIIERLIQSSNVFSVLIFDLDHFKKVNDTFGHAAGDHVLKTCVEVINQELRAIDYIGRWGGEEFLILLPDVHEKEAYIVAERIRKCVLNTDFGLSQTVTISIGIAETSNQDHTAEEIVNYADLALYEAKRQGRNRTIIHSNRGNMYEG